MTPHWWDTEISPGLLLQHLQRNWAGKDLINGTCSPDHSPGLWQPRERKLRLVAVDCCRRVWHLLPGGDWRRAVGRLERWADGLLPCAAAQRLGDDLWVARHLEAGYAERAAASLRPEPTPDFDRDVRQPTTTHLHNGVPSRAARH